jgi:hypothetical protein
MGSLPSPCPDSAATRSSSITFPPQDQRNPRALQGSQRVTYFSPPHMKEYNPTKLVLAKLKVPHRRPARRSHLPLESLSALHAGFAPQPARAVPAYVATAKSLS